MRRTGRRYSKRSRSSGRPVRLGCLSNWLDSINVPWTHELSKVMHPSGRSRDERVLGAHRSCLTANCERPAILKNHYDPTNLFRQTRTLVQQCGGQFVTVVAAPKYVTDSLLLTGATLRSVQAKGQRCRDPLIPPLPSQAVRSAPPRSCAASHAAIDHKLRACHVAGRVGGEEQHPVSRCPVLAQLCRAAPQFWLSGSD
jgi:hypothetical protein